MILFYVHWEIRGNYLRIYLGMRQNHFGQPWTFNNIIFGALNTNAADSVFSVQMLDIFSNTIGISSTIANSTSGFGPQPWNYNVAGNLWEYSVLQNSINGHQASITGLVTGVSRIIVHVDDHLGIDNFKLDLTPPTSPIPEPTSLALLGLGLAGFGFSRKKKKT
jgi:hypothetical protein